MEYKVVLESFEGPLDLLLHLIEKAELDIYDIPISVITDQYMDYFKKMKRLDLEITSEFLVMASTLLEIKSKMLLPKLDDDKGSAKDEDKEDPRFALIHRLLEYKKYKLASQELKKREKSQEKVFHKPREDLNYIDSSEKDDSVLDDLELSQLVKALQNVLKKKGKYYEPKQFNRIKRDKITLNECTSRVRGLLKKKPKINFSELFYKRVTKEEIVMTFLSILELTRLKEIVIVQTEDFSDIIITKNYIKDTEVPI